MATTSFKGFGILLILSLFCTSTFAIKCYVCNSAIQSNCDRSPPPEEYLMECSQSMLEHHNDATSSGDKPVPPPPQGQEPLPSPSSSQQGQQTPAAAKPAVENKGQPMMNRSARTVDEGSKHPGSDMNKAGSLETTAEKHFQNATYCRKTIYHIPKQENGPNSTLPASQRVLRSCGFIPDENSKEAMPSGSSCKWLGSGSNGIQMDQCVCTSDNCNSAKIIEYLRPQTLILLGLAAACFFHMM